MNKGLKLLPVLQSVSWHTPALLMRPLAAGAYYWCY